MTLKIYGPVGKGYNPIEGPDTPSKNRYKQIRDLAWDIRRIKDQTEYIKDTGKEPPKTPDFYKRLDIIK